MGSGDGGGSVVSRESLWEGGSGGKGEGIESRGSSRKVGSGEGHCARRDSHVYPGGSGRDSRERRVFGLGTGGGVDRVCWEGVGGRGVGGMSGGGGWISAVTVNAAGVWVEKLIDG